MTTDEQVSALRDAAAKMRGDALYWIVADIAGRQYACTGEGGALLGFTRRPERAAKLPLDPAMRMLRQVRRRMAPNADVEAVP